MQELQNAHTLLSEILFNAPNFKALNTAVEIEIDAYHPTEQALCNDSDESKTPEDKWTKYSKLLGTYTVLSACLTTILAISKQLGNLEQVEAMRCLQNATALLTQWLTSITESDSEMGLAIEKIFSDDNSQ